MEFAEKLRTLRKNKLLSQTSLAELLKVSRRTVCSWEKEGRHPNDRKLYYDLASILECPVEYLMSDTSGLISGIYDKFERNGSRSSKDLLLDIQAFFSSNYITNEEKDILMFGIHEAYIESRKQSSPEWKKLTRNYP